MDSDNLRPKLNDTKPPTPLAPQRDRAWVEVRTAALRHNLDAVGALTKPGVRLIPMVKANGYGLGVKRVIDALRPARPFGWGVATIAEGLELKRLGARAPVMIYAPVAPAALPRAVSAGLIPSISDLDGLNALRDLATHPDPATHAPAPIAFQVEVDTGMGRAGLALDQPLPLRAAAQSGLRLYGVFTHLHSADHDDLNGARDQIARFDHFISGLRRSGDLPSDTLVHCANSAASLRLESRTANAVRPGIYLYGATTWAAPDAPPSQPPDHPPPQPVVAVRARILLVRDVPPGTTLGYGATYAASGHERWAVAGIGYGDGLPRALGNRGQALFRGRRVPIIGRISMDTCVLRISGKPAPNIRPGDIVTFIGYDGGIALTLEEVAQLAGTIPYEILTGLSRRLPRISL